MTGEQMWNLGDWRLRAIYESKRAEATNPLPRLLNKEIYSENDYAVRKKGDHFESYNRITGESLFEAFSYEEAMADVRAVFH